MELKELETRKAELIEAVESWRSYGEEGDYIKDHFDGLLYSDNTLVISW